MINQNITFLEGNVMKKTSNFMKNLATEVGIHIGDGSMNCYKKSGSYQYTYTGHAIDDIKFGKYVEKLIENLYGLKASGRRFQNNTYQLRYTHKKLINLKRKIGLPLGPKIRYRFHLGS